MSAKLEVYGESAEERFEFIFYKFFLWNIRALTFVRIAAIGCRLSNEVYLFYFSQRFESKVCFKL